MATKQEIKQELARLTKLIQRDELNIVEHVIGIAAERVPIDPATKREITSIRVERTIHEANGIKADGFWEATGDPNHGGLPRGYDLDLFNAIMAVWGGGDPPQGPLSVPPLYPPPPLTGPEPHNPP